MIIYVFLVAKTTCKGALLPSQRWMARAWHCPLVATPLGTKGKPVCKHLPFDNHCGKNKIYAATSSSSTTCFGFRKPNLIPCDGLAKWSQDFGSSRLLETLSLVFMLANLLKSRPVKHVKHRIINSNFLPEVFRYDQTSASFLQSYHGSHT